MRRKPQRCAVVYPYPYVDQCPQVLSMVEYLHEHAWEIDLYAVWGKPGGDGLPGLTRTRMRGDPWAWTPYGVYRALKKKYFITAWSAKDQAARPYDVIFAVDAQGLAMALKLRGFRKSLVVYISLEILVQRDMDPTDHQAFRMHDFEKRYLPRCFLYIVQDKERAALLINEYALDEKKVLLMPNAFRGCASIYKNGKLKRKYDIPDDRRIALYAGSWCEGMCLPEILKSVHSWPDPWVLLLHSRYDEKDLPDKRYMRKLVEVLVPTDRVYFSNEKLSPQEYDEMVGDADACIALYESVPGAWSSLSNNRLMGFASGKVSACLRRGIPVIVNSYTNLSDWVVREQAGLLIDQENTIGDCLAALQRDYDSYSQNALKTYNTLLSPDESLSRFGEIMEIEAN